MQCYPEQLPLQLQSPLSPCYLVFGNDALLQFEAVEAIRQACRQQRYERTAQLTADDKFEWQQLRAESQSLSLFSQRQWIELELPNGNTGKEGARQLQDYATNLPEDQILILFGPRLTKDKMRAKWFQTLDKIGVSVITNTPTGTQFHRWLGQRAKSLKLALTGEGIQILADQYEGNLQAAAQELNKLVLVFGNDLISTAELIDSLGNQARYTTFQLTDELLNGDTVRSLKILQGLKDEGAEPVLLIWQLNKEVKILHQLKSARASPTPDTLQKLGIWRQRQPIYLKALNRLTTRHLNTLIERLAKFDLVYKSSSMSTPWLWLQHICLMFDPAWQSEQSLFDMGQSDAWEQLGRQA